MVAITQDDVLVIPVTPYDPYELLPRAIDARGARHRQLLLRATALCLGAASVAFSITLAVLLAIHF
jgi:hypothetical protein